MHQKVFLLGHSKLTNKRLLHMPQTIQQICSAIYFLSLSCKRIQQLNLMGIIRIIFGSCVCVDEPQKDCKELCSAAKTPKWFVMGNVIQTATAASKSIKNQIYSWGCEKIVISSCWDFKDTTFVLWHRYMTFLKKKKKKHFLCQKITHLEKTNVNKCSEVVLYNNLPFAVLDLCKPLNW